ncbi:MAG: hypothetical protein CMI00_05960 [Oceanospirillaceae bacterium]|nr:hypothetical protein [Oceanospirillaceae bacterium]|tara:strand:- start:1627 stop:2451 length:825 start_codon:yes stop_codon:yes gene_type:complete
MKLISFDALRTLHMPGVTYIKPDHFYDRADEIRNADWVLFPQYWQINPLIYGLKVPVFPSPASYHLGHDKVEMTRAFRLIAPQHVPYTLIEANTPESAARVWSAMPAPFVAKIPKSSMGDGVFLIESQRDWQAYLAVSPVIYAQEYLPIDRDLRIVWAGNQIVGGYWRIQAEQGFYNNVAKGGQVEDGILPPEAIALVERLAQGLGIDHGGFDIAMVGHYPYVFEFNRIFGNQGLSGKQQAVDDAILSYLNQRSDGLDPDNPSKPPRAPLPQVL